MPMLLKRGQKLLMTGDSITDCGRARPVGEGRGAMGWGYVAMLDAILTSQYPEMRIRVVNMGVSGDTVRDLEARWESDTYALAPDWVSILIGVNDVWRQFDSPLMPEAHVPPGEYAERLERLITGTQARVSGGVIVLTPFIMEPNKSDPMRARMDEYAETARRLAGRHGCPVCDLPPAFDRLWAHMHPMNIAWDRIHPNHAGAMLIARELLKTIELEEKEGIPCQN